MAVYSRLYLRSFDNWRFWIRKHKRITYFNKWARWYWQNLFVCKGFKWTQVQIFDQKAQKCWDKTFKWSKCIYWVLKYYGWRLWKYWWLQSKQKKESFNFFDDLIADIMTNKKFQAIIKQLFVRCRKLNISLIFITQFYLSVPKDVRLNSTHYLIIKINNKREL